MTGIHSRSSGIASRQCSCILMPSPFRVQRQGLFLDFGVVGVQLILGGSMYSRTIPEFSEAFQLDCLLKVTAVVAEMFGRALTFWPCILDAAAAAAASSRAVCTFNANGGGARGGVGFLTAAFVCRHCCCCCCCDFSVSRGAFTLYSTA